MIIALEWYLEIFMERNKGRNKIKQTGFYLGLSLVYFFLNLPSVLILTVSHHEEYNIISIL
jgi:hypothetical protein